MTKPLCEPQIPDCEPLSVRCFRTFAGGFSISRRPAAVDTSLERESCAILIICCANLTSFTLPFRSTHHLPKIMNKAKAQGRKTVVISDVTCTTVAVVESPEESWYTHEETAEMQLETRREVLRLSTLVSTSPESFTKDHQLQCLGIESYIVPAIAMQARQERMKHERLILRAQQLTDCKDLSILSKKTSTSACQRAYVFANRNM
jgi:hypothetical protein